MTASDGGASWSNPGEMRLGAAKEIERFVTTRVAAGNDPPQMLPIARANRIDAEIDLLKLKAEIEKGGKK